jgi:lipoate-protein ligase A
MNRACYGTLSSYEVVVGQRKIVGLDMIRRRHGSLLQAGVLLQWDSELLAQLLGHTAAEQERLRSGLLERAVGLDSLTDHPVNVQEVITAFEQAVTQQEPVPDI